MKTQYDDDVPSSIEEPEQDKIRVAPDPRRKPATLGFVKMMRGADILELIEAAPLAFTLAAVIALRARFKPGINLKNGTCRGECFLGDFKECGMTEQQYRTAKKQLAKWGFAEFRGKRGAGTIAQLADTRLFDVLDLLNPEKCNDLNTPKNTNKHMAETTLDRVS